MINYILDFTDKLYNKYKDRNDVHFLIKENQFSNLSSIIEADEIHYFFIDSGRANQKLSIINNNKKLSWKKIDRPLDISDFDDITNVYWIESLDLYKLKSLKLLSNYNFIKTVVPYFWSNPNKIVKLQDFFVVKQDVEYLSNYVDYIYCGPYEYLLDESATYPKEFDIETIKFYNNLYVNIRDEKIMCGGRCDVCDKCDYLMLHHDKMINTLKKSFGIIKED